MENESKRQPYSPPQITRVVLRPEQAILSQCSVGQGLDSQDILGCVTGCKDAADPGDNAGRAS
jgi:hypothetical protein